MKDNIKIKLNKVFSVVNVKPISSSETELIEWLGLRNENKKITSEITYFTCLKMLSETIAKMPIKFYEKTEDIDSEVNDTITDTVENMTGKNTKIISFASEKNTEVESVLFLIKSPAIKKISEDKVVQEVEEKLTIWQKFLKIFGLY